MPRSPGRLATRTCTITVNGVQGTNDGYGNWTAGNVPLPPGGTVTLQATAQLSGGATLQTLLEQERGPIVFTQTYGYQLDYTRLDRSGADQCLRNVSPRGAVGARGWRNQPETRSVRWMSYGRCLEQP